MSVTVKHGTLERIMETLKSARSLEEIGKVAVKEMRISLERGISPVRGERRFQKYSESYTKAIKAGWLEHSKNVRPVNLILSGRMVNAITYKAQKGKLEVGIWDPEMVELASYHQEGTEKMPQRKFIPDTSGEYLTVTIDRALINKLKDLIKESIR